MDLNSLLVSEPSWEYEVRTSGRISRYTLPDGKRVVVKCTEKTSLAEATTQEALAEDHLALPVLYHGWVKDFPKSVRNYFCGSKHDPDVSDACLCDNYYIVMPWGAPAEHAGSEVDHVSFLNIVSEKLSRMRVGWEAYEHHLRSYDFGNGPVLVAIDLEDYW